MVGTKGLTKTRLHEFCADRPTEFRCQETKVPTISDVRPMPVSSPPLNLKRLVMGIFVGSDGVVVPAEAAVSIQAADKEGGKCRIAMGNRGCGARVG